MVKSEVKIGADYKKFVYKFHESMVENKITLVYEGEINQEITNVFSEMAEAGMEETEHETTKKRVYHVMVECLQNICKHADEKEFTDDIGRGKGILLVGNDNDQYSITTGNTISNENIDGLAEMLDRINAMSPDEIKKTYKQMIREARLSDKGGAGLGFIDMVKKTGNPIEYMVHPIDDDKSFLVIISRVNRIKE